MKIHAGIIVSILSVMRHAEAFYLPGVAPKSFSKGDSVELKVNAMTSIEDLYPLEYYRLPFCKPSDGIMLKNENLGELLKGDRIENSPYIIKMKIDMYCEQVCVTNLGRGEPLQGNDKKKRRISQNKVVRSVRREYHNNWIIDNLPAASKVAEGFVIVPMQGFPVGFVDPRSRLSYIYNHVNIELQYHEYKAHI